MKMFGVRKLACVMFFPLLALIGCGGKSIIYVTLSPSAVQTLDAGQSSTITANLFHDSSNAGVSWSLAGAGSLANQTKNSVVYVAPSTVTGVQTDTITAVPVKNSLFAAALQINLKPALTITTTSLPGGVQNSAYSTELKFSGGTSPYKWALASGSLPAGLSLSSNGVIAGTPTSTGTSNFTVQITDSATSPNTVTATYTLTIKAGVIVTGYVYSGAKPVKGATIELWNAGTTGYGSVATPLLATPVTTDQNGGFSFSGGACPMDGLVYVTAAGGNGNPAIALMAALGPCANLAGNASSIYINEVTTVAAVWAMQQFAGSSWSALSTSPAAALDTFGTSPTNLQGLANAMATASVLANAAAGTSPGSDGSGNQSNVEYWQVNTIADILDACDESPSACNTLFANTTAGEHTPTDTIQAALNMAKYPTANISALTGIISTNPPFQPINTSTNDFTIGLNYLTGSNDPRWIAFDQFGNAWITTTSSSVFEMDPAGNVIPTPTSYTLNDGTNSSIGASYEVAVDTENNAWFTDETNHAIFEVRGSSSAGGANGGAGTAISTNGVSTNNLEAIAVDGNDNVWATISGSHLVGLLSNNSYSSLVTGGSLTTDPFGMAIDLSNQSSFGNTSLSGGGSFIYALSSGGCASKITLNGKARTVGSIGMDFTAPTTIGSKSYAAGDATPLSYIVDAACNNTTNVPNNNTYSSPRVFMSVPYGIAFDHGNNMWVVNQSYTSTDASSGQYSLSKLVAQNYGANTAFTGAAAAPNFTFTSITGGGLNAPFYLAMDGASAAWVANSTGSGGVSAFSNDGTAISPSTGFYGGTYTAGTTTHQRSFKSARGIAVDGSGNVWVANTGATYVTVMVGVATPTVTPLSVGIKNGTLASKP